MDQRKKFWFVLIGAVLTMAVIACSCGSLTGTPTASSGGSVPSTGGQGPMPDLVGKWLDPDTSGTVTTIAWQNNEYVATDTSNPNHPGYKVTASNWSNNVLTWTYCVPQGACVTTVTVSVSGNNLDTTWSNDQGYSGTTTLTRQP
jgi:hypothetical protein